ncbi:MAG: class I SAM-dependent methyltransferase [Flavobacteriales bacterium]
MGQFFQPQSILEFGTSLGLTSLYIAKAAPQSEIISVEGSKEIANFASTLFAKQAVKNVRVVHQKFDEFISTDLEKEQKFDLIYIDGNHTYDATVKYFLELLNHVNENTWFVFDDIYWSRGMNRAWLEIINHERVSLSMDFFHFGVIMLQPRMTKEHFKLNGLLSF